MRTIENIRNEIKDLTDKSIKLSNELIVTEAKEIIKFLKTKNIKS